MVEVNGVIDFFCASLTSKGIEHRVIYLDGHPTRNQPRPTGLNFGEQTATRVFPLVIAVPQYSTDACCFSFQVWNSVGIVRCHKEDEISSIEVEFHDASTHHPLHLTNHLNHTMAALSSTALLLACKVQDDMTRYKTICL